MRASLLSNTTICALLAALSSAIPLEPSPSISPRHQFCDNAPTPIAGPPLLPPRALLLPPRKTTDTILWYAPLTTATYIILQISASLPPHALLSALTSAHTYALSQITTHGDGPIPHGEFFFASAVGAAAGLDVHTWNTNNHQQTWGVLGAALAALRDYMRRSGRWGEVAFTIFDGGREVGRGTVS